MFTDLAGAGEAGSLFSFEIRGFIEAGLAANISRLCLPARRSRFIARDPLPFALGKQGNIGISPFGFLTGAWTINLILACNTSKVFVRV